MATSTRRILVTGTTHSGKNWVSLFLARLLPCAADQEPFHPWSPPGIPTKEENGGFKFLTDTSSPELTNQAAAAFSSFSTAALAFGVGRGGLKGRLHNSVNQLRRVRIHRSHANVIIKDPYCLFSSEWLRKRLGWLPWLIIREPVSYVAALAKEATPWDVEFHLRDPALIRHLDEVGSGCATAALRQARAGLLVTSIHRWITAAVHFKHLLSRHSNELGWAFSSLESLNSEPEVAFCQAVRSLGVPRDLAHVKAAIPSANETIPEALRLLQQTKDTLTPPTAGSVGEVLSGQDVLLIKRMTSELHEEIKARLKS
jgi:hypothetical protein